MIAVFLLVNNNANIANMQETNHIVHLLRDFLSGDIDATRSEELQQLFVEYPCLREVVEELSNEQGLQNALHAYGELYTDTFQKREEQVLRHVLTRIKQPLPPSRRPGASKRLWLYASVAAVVVAVLSATLLWRKELVESQPKEETLDNFTPGSNMASLKFSNGKHVDLSDAYGGIIIDDQIVYEDGSALSDEGSLDENVMFTLETPRGGQYQVTLSDGTKVWLNADSKLHYPHRFSDDARYVELEGEAYFEVTHREKQPFIVTTPREKVEVLGTHFNVNSYQTDLNSTVALIEGEVRVSSGPHATAVLKPGQQSFIANGKLKVQDIDVEESVAWKNGEFMFNNEALSSAMKKVARWYDLEIEISPELKDVVIWGSISRYDNFNKVLNLIKMTDERIQFDVAGKRVVFMK